MVVAKIFSLCGRRKYSLTEHLSGGHDLAGVHSSHESLRLSLECTTAGLFHGSDQLAGHRPIAVCRDSLWPAPGLALLCFSAIPLWRSLRACHFAVCQSLMGYGVLQGVLMLWQS